MKAKKRTLILLLAFLALALAALAAANLAAKKATADSTDADSAAAVLTSYAADAIEEITYTYDGQTISLKSTDGTWALADDAAYHINQTVVNSMVTALCSLSAKRSIPDVTDQSPYGTDQPQQTVTMQVSGKTVTLCFGTENSVTGDVYLRMDGDSTVYTVDAAKQKAFSYAKTDLYDTSYTPVTIQRGDLTAISYHFSDSSENFTVALKAESEPSGSSAAASASDSSAGSAVSYDTVWYLENDSAALDQSAIETMIEQLTTPPTAQITQPGDLSQYGLAAPIITVQLTGSDGTQQTFDLGIGQDNFYLMKEGESSVYTVTVDLLNAFSATGDELKSAQGTNALENAFSDSLNSAS